MGCGSLVAHGDRPRRLGGATRSASLPYICRPRRRNYPHDSTSYGRPWRPQRPATLCSPRERFCIVAGERGTCPPDRHSIRSQRYFAGWRRPPDEIAAAIGINGSFHSRGGAPAWRSNPRSSRRLRQSPLPSCVGTVNFEFRRRPQKRR
jgi:hypothetical protein